jgi:hypothetical protein
MKKILVSLLILGTVLTPALAKAQGTSLKDLVELFISLGIIIPEKAVQARQAVSTIDTKKVQTPCYKFAYDLTVGAQSEDVTNLHRVLVQENILNADVFQDGRTVLSFDENTAASVVKLQAKYGIRQTGYVGPLTRAKLNSMYGCGTSRPVPPTPAPYPLPITNIDPVINGISAPTTRAVGQAGTWIIKAYDPQNGNLSYSVVWGDEKFTPSDVSGSALRAAPVVQNATFTHAYASAGTYTPVFYVQNASGRSAKTSATVQVGEGSRQSSIFPAALPPAYVGQSYRQEFTVDFSPSVSIYLISGILPPGLQMASAIPSCAAPISGQVVRECRGQTIIFGTPTETGSYTFTVANNSPSAKRTYTLNVSSGRDFSLTVLSPNGGETWTRGTTQTIKWQDYSTYPICPLGSACPAIAPAPKYYDITLAPYYPPCTGTVCPMYAYRQPYTIAKNVYGQSYSWLVGKTLDLDGTAYEGAYTIEICQAGSGTPCDSSDASFAISL